MRREKLRFAWLVALVLAGAACTRNPALQPGHAVCHVCRNEGDLACVDVTIEPDTPRAVYAGETHYFCSETCRDAFVEDPRKYLPR